MMRDSGQGDIGGLNQGEIVYGSDGDQIGILAESGPDYLRIERGGFSLKEFYLPWSAIARAELGSIHLRITKREAESRAREHLPSAGDAWYNQ